jgi:sugar lactone lactonase YvrE
MRQSNVMIILVLMALATAFFFTPALAYVPLYSPSEIAVDDGGNVYTIMNPGTVVGEGIFVYATNGAELKSYLRPGISDVAIDSNGIVYVLNLAQKRVERLEKNGSFSVVWGDDNPGHFINYFAIDRDDNILVSDFNYSQAETRVIDGCILKISPEGKVTDVINSSLAVPLNKPFRMSVSDNGTIYVTDFGRCFRAIYPDGNGSTIIHTSPDNGTFNQVLAAEAGDDGYLYVGETSNGRVRKLTADGTQVAKWDGCGPERFITPSSIVADRDGRVYISDMQNQRIVWFDGDRYRFGENATENLAGKGVLWDNVIAGDNYTIAHQNEGHNIGDLQATPGFAAVIALIGICLAGAVLCLGRSRKD